jgi:hypothetical protein
MALALTSVILGVLAVALSFILIGFLLGLAGLFFGLAHLSRKVVPRAMARWGVGLSIAGMAASVGFGVLYFSFYNKFSQGMKSARSSQAVSPSSLAPLPAASQLLNPVVLWSHSIPGAQSMCVGDWDKDRTSRILVADGSTLHALDSSGAERSATPLSDNFKIIEFGRNKTDGARLLGYNPWGQGIEVVDHNGKKLWSYHSTLGADGAHWGDLDGDGNDEMIVGMNGFGGLVALSSDGKKIWSAKLANVWNQAIVPATSNRPARVFATEAGGSVRVFDGAGRSLATLQPGGGYFAQMTAHAIDDKSIQIIGINVNSTVAFDETGKVAWTTSAITTAGGWRSCYFAAGDLKGDGSMQWVFLDGAGDLVIATPAGQKIASISSQKSLQSFSVAPRVAGQSGLLITLDHGNVTAYALQP